jgi:hypothetical protein
MAMIMETDTPPDEFDIEALYNNIEPAPPTDESIAQWIVPILDKHKSKHTHIHTTQLILTQHRKNPHPIKEQSSGNKHCPTSCR